MGGASPSRVGRRAGRSQATRRRRVIGQPAAIARGMRRWWWAEVRNESQFGPVSTSVSDWSSQSSPDRDDRCAVGPVLDEGSVDVAFFGDPEAMLRPILTVALEGTISNIGGATVTDPFFDVIDLTTRRAHWTTDVLTAVDHQLERFSGGAVEQAAPPPEVGDHTLTVDHHSPDVARRAQQG